MISKGGLAYDIFFTRFYLATSTSMCLLTLMYIRYCFGGQMNDVFFEATVRKRVAIPNAVVMYYSQLHRSFGLNLAYC